MDDEEYDISDSEDDYSAEDKLLLQDVRDAMRRKDISSEEEVYGFGDSDSDGENGEENMEENMEENEEGNMGSDLEDEEKLPDDRAWGKRKKSFYSTDFVDQDYGGTYQGEEAEVAELEEQEARNIQKRLVQQLNEADFSITEAIDLAEVTDVAGKQEVIPSDLTKLTKRQKLDLVKKESPEFFVVVQDFKEKMQEAQKILPLINYFKKAVKQSFPALDFLQIKLSVILKQLLEQLDKINTKTFQSQLDSVLKLIESGEEILMNTDLLEKKTTLKVLTKKVQSREKDAGLKKEREQKARESEFKDDKIKVQEQETLKLADGKRAVTYEMAKNKGLIPKRSKEQRNPRVKHRKKYEKAKIRRRGQVRTPRQEIPVYSGEPTGIKIGLTKSIKLKH